LVVVVALQVRKPAFGPAIDESMGSCGETTLPFRNNRPHYIDVVADTKLEQS
jgi:hypothetical protein